MPRIYTHNGPAGGPPTVAERGAGEVGCAVDHAMYRYAGKGDARMDHCGVLQVAGHNE